MRTRTVHTFPRKKSKNLECHNFNFSCSANDFHCKHVAQAKLKYHYYFMRFRSSPSLAPLTTPLLAPSAYPLLIVFGGASPPPHTFQTVRNRVDEVPRSNSKSVSVSAPALRGNKLCVLGARQLCSPRYSDFKLWTGSDTEFRTTSIGGGRSEPAPPFTAT